MKLGHSPVSWLTCVNGHDYRGAIGRYTYDTRSTMPIIVDDTCPDCGAEPNKASQRTVHAKVDATRRCTASCRNAYNHYCLCSCGGRNHMKGTK